MDVEPEPRSSPLSTLREERHHSPPPSPSYHPTLLPAAISDDHIDPDLLQSASAVSITGITPTDPCPIDSPASPPPTTRTITQTSDHPLTSFSISRPQSIYRAFLSGDSSNSLPTSVANPPATSPRRSLASAAILASLTTASTATTAPATLSSAANHPTNPLTTATPPASLATPPSGPGKQNAKGGQPRGRGWGRGGGGRGRRKGGGVANENTADNSANTNANTDPNVYQDGLLSPASRRRIDILNKRVYAPDGTYHGPPLGANHSTNVDGVYPCVTFQGPPPTAGPKKRSRDVVSEADIIPGKRARKERVRTN